MRNRHPENRQLVGLSRESTASWDHVTQLGNVGRHFVATSPLDFAMILSTAKRRNGKQCKCAPRLGKNNAISQNQRVFQCNKKDFFSSVLTCSLGKQFFYDRGQSEGFVNTFVEISF